MPRGASTRSHFEDFFALCADLLLVLDAEERIEVLNPAASSLLGVSAEEKTGKSFLGLLHEEDRDRLAEAFSRARREGGRVIATGRIREREGAYRLVEWKVQASPGSSQLYLVGSDTTELAATAAIQRELASRHEAILAAIPEILAEVDTDKVYTWVNDAGLAFFGPDVIGREAREFFCDEESENVYARVEGVFEGKRDTVYLESFQRRADGEKRLLGWWCRSLKDESGKVTGALSMARDITEARQLEASYRESEHKVQALFDNAAQGIISIDRKGRILTANPMALHQFGYAREELLGRPVEVLLPQSRSSAHVEHREAYFRTPRTRPMGHGVDLMGRRKDGGEFPAEISLSYIGSGEDAVAVAFINDITERKRADAERERLERHLEHATKMEAIGRLAGGIAHDFNNLLTALSGFSEIALDELPESHPLYEGARETFKTCQRSASLVRRLLAVSRRQVLQPMELDLNAKLAELEKMLRGVLGEDIDLRVQLEPELGFVKVDESQVEQVVLNLVVNARDAMPHGGHLLLSTSRLDVDEAAAEQVGVPSLGPYVRLTVTDTGCGMEPETLEHIFEPFFTTKEKGKGTGLGLATVYGIVHQSGGHIWAYSEAGKGTTFKLYLPRIDRHPFTEEARTRTEEGRRGSETILVVEDENTVRLVATSNLRKAGYRVLEARNAEQALAIVEESDGIDLLLTDVVMPRVNGTELARRVRERLPDIRVVYMSGHADDALVHHGFFGEGEAPAFLEKPFTRETLTRQVREVLDRTEAGER